MLSCYTTTGIDRAFYMSNNSVVTMRALFERVSRTQERKPKPYFLSVFSFLSIIYVLLPVGLDTTWTVHTLTCFSLFIKITRDWFTKQRKRKLHINYYYSAFLWAVSLCCTLWLGLGIMWSKSWSSTVWEVYRFWNKTKKKKQKLEMKKSLLSTSWVLPAWLVCVRTYQKVYISTLLLIIRIKL